MTRYADPQRCPDCRKQIEYGATSCPACALSLAGSLAQDLFATLSTADDLLAQLRAVQPVAVPANISATDLPSSPLPDPHAQDPTGQPATARGPRGLSAASVPKILLGLGAACVLVAALVFLAVTWSVMGVAGRTATLVGFTVVAGGLAALMAGRGLRVAAEALCIVALGLLTLDVFGARDSGWFGEISTPTFLVLLGGLLAVVAAGAGVAVRRSEVPALTGSEIVSALGVALVAVGVASTDRFADSAALVLAVLVSVAATAILYRAKLEFAAIGGMVVTGSTWFILAVNSLDRAVAHPSAHALWLDLQAWPFLVSTGLVAALALMHRLPTPVRVAALAVAEALAATLLLLPFAQDTTTKGTLSVLVVMMIAGTLTWFVARPWSLSGALTLGIGAVWMLIVSVQLVSAAMERFVRVGDALWTGDPGDRFPAPRLAAGIPASWLLPIAVVALVGVAVVLAQASPTVDRVVAPFADLVLGAALLMAAGITTLVLYPVPVWLVLALLLVISSGFAAWAIRRQSAVPLGTAGLFLLGALALSLHDEWLSAAAFTVAVATTGAVHLRWHANEVSAVGGFLLAASTAGALWCWGAVVGAEARWVSLVGILVMAVLVLAGSAATRGRVGSAFVGVEFGAAAATVVLALVGVATTPYSQEASWTAIYLTLAGAAVAMVALVRKDRRHLAWLGGALLAAATWVRLWDTGVRVPEAYTLPAAVALGLVGLAHLRRNPGSSTMTALSPGLALGLVPSLLWVLREPLELRAVILGAGCLILVMAGLRLRWTAPVVFAATVGSLVVLRHAAPYVDAAVPRWVLIGAAGAVLIGMGVTWERRVQEARHLAGYVRALR